MDGSDFLIYIDYLHFSAFTWVADGLFSIKIFSDNKNDTYESH